jgi:hypothetical protein
MSDDVGWIEWVRMESGEALSQFRASGRGEQLADWVESFRLAPKFADRLSPMYVAASRDILGNILGQLSDDERRQVEDTIVVRALAGVYDE